MSKKDSKPEKAGSEKRAMAERQEAEDNVKKNMERLRALRIEREGQKKTRSYLITGQRPGEHRRHVDCN
jgi:hypothetical protein